MKKILLIPFLLFAALSMTACGSGSDEPFTPEQLEQSENPGGGDDSDDNPDRPVPGGNGRYLVLFASRTNNTERVAQLIQTTLDCGMLEVEPETAYDNDYNSMLERSQEELAASVRAIIRLSKPRWRVLTITTSYSSVIQSGTAVWRHRCKHSCIPMPPNLPENESPCSSPAAAAAFPLQSMKPAVFAPMQR